MSLLVAFGAGEIGDRQINEDRWPSCAPFVWARPEDERGGGEFRQGSDFFVGRIRNPAPPAPGVGTHGSIKSEARRLMPNCMAARVTKARRVSARFS